jgi:hypothetical protein
LSTNKQHTLSLSGLFALDFKICYVSPSTC